MDDRLYARLMLDLMLPARLADALRSEGYDVAEARALPGNIQQDDEALLGMAARQRRVLVTCNYRDPASNFCVIHEEWQARGRGHAGIILVSQGQIGDRRRRWEVRDRLLHFLDQHTWDELQDQLWWLA